MSSRAFRVRAQSGFSTNFHKECKAFTASAQSRAGFLLKRIGARAQSVDIERDVLCALPEHYGRAGGAR